MEKSKKKKSNLAPCRRRQEELKRRDQERKNAPQWYKEFQTEMLKLLPLPGDILSIGGAKMDERMIERLKKEPMKKAIRESIAYALVRCETQQEAAEAQRRHTLGCLGHSAVEYD